MDLFVSAPSTEQDWKSYYLLRWEILRKPWQQPPGSEKDNHENEAVHAFIKTADNRVIAVGRLQINTGNEGQIRYMAVHNDFNGMGFGRMLLEYLENKARRLGVQKIVLDARENAVNFYVNCNYKLVEKGHLLFNDIQHWRMEKFLKPFS